MTDRLKYAIEEAAEILPPEQQDQLPKQLLKLLGTNEAAALTDFETED